MRRPFRERVGYEFLDGMQALYVPVCEENRQAMLRDGDGFQGDHQGLLTGWKPGRNTPKWRKNSLFSKSPSFFHPGFFGSCGPDWDIRSMKPFLKFGLGTGIVSGLWGLVSFTVVGWLNGAFFHPSISATDIRSYSGLFSVVILVMGIYLGMRQAKVKNGGILTYGQAVKTGVLVACVTALLVAAFSWLYCAVINPGYADFMVSDTGRVLAAAGKTPQEISQRLEGVRKEFSTGMQVMEALVGQVVVGSITSLILGFFTRTKK
jgi:hypothetical protein